MNKLFCIKIEPKTTKIESLFDLLLQVNIISVDLVKKMGLEVHDHPIPYPLGWVNKDVELKVQNNAKLDLLLLFILLMKQN